MNGGLQQYARVLADAMQPIPLVAVRIVTPLPVGVLTGSQAEYELAMIERYGDDWETEL